MLHRAFIARSYVLQSRINTNIQNGKRLVYICKKDGDRSIEFNIDQIFKSVEFDILTEITCNNLGEEEKLVFNNSLQHAKMYISVFFDRIKEQSELYIDKGVISEVVMYYPFIRISDVDNSVIIAFFFYFEYADGRKTFTVFERIPDDEDENMLALQHNFVDTFDSSVRYSRFVTGGVFEYIDDIFTKNARKENMPVVTHNYVLAVFIKKNFEIDILNLKHQNIIWTEGELIKQINKSQSEQILVDENCVYVAFDSEVSDYNDHLIRVMVSFFTIIHFSATYFTFKKLIMRSNLSLNDIERLKNVSTRLNMLVKELKIELSHEEKKIVKDNLPKIMEDPRLKRLIDIIKIISILKSFLPPQ